MIILMLLIIVTVLLVFLLWVFTEIVITPHTHSKVEQGISAKDEVMDDEGSIMGSTNYVEQKRPSSRIPSPQIPKEKIADAFTSDPYLDTITTDSLIDDEQEHVEPPEDVNDVISDSKLPDMQAIEEDMEISKTSCQDFNQLFGVAVNIARGNTLTEENKHSLEQLEGTELFESMYNALPEQMQRVRAVLQTAYS